MSETVKRGDRVVMTRDVWPQMAKLLGLEGRMIRKLVVTLERNEPVLMELSEFCISDLSPPESEVTT